MFSECQIRALGVLACPQEFQESEGIIEENKAAFVLCWGRGEVMK